MGKSQRIEAEIMYTCFQNDASILSSPPFANWLSSERSLTLITPESTVLLIADYAENYTWLLPQKDTSMHFFFFQLMSQMRWFHKLSSVILIIVAHYWNIELNCWVCCAHHCISDDLNKSNEQMTHCLDFVRK